MALTNHEQLLLFVTDTTVGGDLVTWLSGLPYPSALARRGTYMRVVKPSPDVIVWPSFVTGEAQSGGPWDEDATFWRVLTERGRRVAVHSLTRDESLPSALPDVISGGGWDLLMLARLGAVNSPEYWLEWDRELTSLALAADPSTMVLVLGLPGDDGGAGVLVAGGGSIAAAGDLGTIDLVDLAPTILWLLDVSPSPRMRGRVVDDIWVSDVEWGEGEQEVLIEHLRGLGYLS